MVRMTCRKREHVERRRMAHTPRYRDAHVGRDEARDEFERATRASRWVTVCGPPGVGKSRCVAEWSRERGEPVCWVGLAGVSGEDAALDALRRALGVEREGAELVPQLAWALERRGVEVLVWDDADTSGLGGRAEALLDEVEGLRMVATSRGRLGPRGERVVTVRPLSEEQGEELLRARALANGVECEASDTAALRRIASVLDGLPLALELAASWLGMMGASELATRLEDGDGLLDAVPLDDRRYGTLHQAVAWSWSQLGEVERSVLGQCACWAGPFTLDDAAAFVDAAGVLGALHRLNGMGLTRTSRRGEATFELYSVVREVALASGSKDELDAARGRIARWLVERARQGDNGERAWETAAGLVEEAGGVDEHGRSWLGVLASRAARTRGELERADVLLDQVGEQDSAHVSLERARVRFAQGRYVESAECARRSREAAGTRDDEVTAALEASMGALYSGDLDAAWAELEGFEEAEWPGLALQRARLFHWTGRRDEALEQYEQALAWARHGGDDDVAARATHNLGVFLLDVSRLDEARRHLEDASARHERAGERLRRAQALNSLGVLEMRARALDAAREAFDESRRIFEGAGHRAGVAMVEANAGMLWLDHGEVERAEACAIEALALTRGDEDAVTRGHARLILGYAMWMAGSLDEAGAVFEQGLDATDGVGHAQTRVSLWAAAGGLAAQRGEVKVAKKLFASARDEMGDGEHDVLAELIGIHELHAELAVWRSGDARKATPSLFRALDVLGGKPAPDDERSEPLRLAQRLVERALGERGDRLLSLSRAEPDALLVEGEVGAMRAPRAAWLDLSRSPALANMARALLDRRLDAPGEGIEPDELTELVWPGERIAPDAATNRLHVAIAKLRRLGLRDLLLREGEGYLLDANVEVVRVTE